ncbi:MAG: hypothetical protein SFV17_27130 [Candidatus Obscuribacter sp.]|nr:hypothetical protein [Candidatus Melainabacteria bacterium]MDX1990397.1 hypothetical protein [Candidatus Obscuribacter sp.]
MKNQDSNIEFAADLGQAQVRLSPELVRIAQKRADGVHMLRDEVARLMVESLILEMDPELEVLIDESASMSQSDNLAAALGVSDIVINGHRLDVRALAEDGTVSINRALIGSQYLSLGTLVVSLASLSEGKVVAFLGAGLWMKAEESEKAKPNQAEARLHLSVDCRSDFDFAATLKNFIAKPVVKLPSTSRLQDVKGDVDLLLNNPDKLISARRKQIFSYLCSNWNEDTLALVESIKLAHSLSSLDMMLRDAARWNNIVEKLTDKLAGQFDKVSRAEIRKQVLACGEAYGAQFRSPAFSKMLLTNLVAGQAAGKKSKLFAALVEKIMGGAGSLDAVRELVLNKTAVELAHQIKCERNLKKFSGFVAASAEEIGMAFQKLALQPAYATHSSGDSGVESINEALTLLEIGEMAEALASIDMVSLG